MKGIKAWGRTINILFFISMEAVIAVGVALSQGTWDILKFYLPIYVLHNSRYNV
jgi:hypothetical protein